MSERLKMARAALVKAQENEAAAKKRLADSSRQVEEVERALPPKRAQLEDGDASTNLQAVASEIAQLDATAKILRERLAEDQRHAEDRAFGREKAEGEILAGEADIDVTIVEAKKKELDARIAALKGELGSRLKELQSAIRTAIGKVARVPEGQRTELLNRLPVRGGGLVSELMQSDMNRPDHLAAVIAGLMRGRM